MLRASFARFKRLSVGIEFSLPNKPGALCVALELFRDHEINLSHVANKPSPLPPHNQTFSVHFDGSLKDPNIQSCLKQLSDYISGPIYRKSTPCVPWFPRKISDLDKFSKATLDGGDQLQSDHPGFNDKEYIKRRQYIASLAREYSHGQNIPTVEYTEVEINTWQYTFNKLMTLYPRLSCKEHNDAIAELISAGIMGDRIIPQLQNLSDYVKTKNWFHFPPCHRSTLSPRLPQRAGFPRLFFHSVHPPSLRTDVHARARYRPRTPRTRAHVFESRFC